MAEYTFRNKKIPLQFTFGTAMFFKQEFGLNMLALFEDDNLDNFCAMVSLHDEKILEIWWYYVEKHFSDRAECIDNLTRDSLTEFKEAFWDAIINFSDPAARPILTDLRKRLPELLKQRAESQFKQALQEQLNESS